MTFSEPYHIEFCISPNTKWVVIGCWTDGVFGIFSLLNEALVWSNGLSTSSHLLATFIPLKFNGSSTKLVINACNTLYVFAPPCLLEDYELEFLSTSINLAQDSRDLRLLLNASHQALIPKHILKQALILQHELEIQDRNKVLDIANSRISSNVALSIHRNGRFRIVQGSFETFFAPSFKQYIISDRLRNALPIGVVELRVDILLFQQSQPFPSQRDVRIFLYPSEEKNEDSIVVFLTQDGLVGVFIDANQTRNQYQIPFGNQTCFAMQQSKDGSSVICLHASGVMIIDLNKKSILSQTAYRANLALWLVHYIAIR